MMLPNFGTVVIFLFSSACLPVACPPPVLFGVYLLTPILDGTSPFWPIGFLLPPSKLSRILF